MKKNNNILLSVEDLRVYFRGNEKVSRAVDGVSFDVRRGETVCIVGESGCGKTVSALTILGLIPSPPGEIEAGKVLFEGENLLNFTEEDLQKVRGNRIAMVFQEPLTCLNPVFTIGDQIGEAINVHEQVEPSALRERCVQLLKDVGIPSPEDRLKDYPHQLSGGQRQRVMIAMALACRPDLIIADEPTTALDVTVQAQILSLFRALQKTGSMSVLYITHDLGVVANIADRVYVMYAGVIAEQGNTSQIFNSPRHPYTQGLLASLPSRSKRGKILHSIPGIVPDPAYKPDGCPFNPRCDFAVDTCRTRFPEMCDYGEEHLSRCPVLFKHWKQKG
ncbi:MAG: ABC transporter ATP-binding protein [Deltaproteobacteria bacterium]|nr:ABC transporter ATP-binding protein [Deltaproteobacteria bacterium]MBW2118741.1 ABC transporter ATP-binding protein [Deltaproteobacteria bacterium]MBW2345265.1 ABC transporter ATP-binding protein [Deltaproteobacteria bacterium]